MTKDEALALVRRNLGKSRVGMMVFGLVVLAIAALIGLTVSPEATTGSRVTSYAVAGGFVALALLLFWVGLVKMSPSLSPLVIALRERPEDVVWIYVQDIAVNVDGIPAPVRSSNVIAKLADGSTVAIVVKKADAESVLEALALLAPKAKAGFSPEREAQFKSDPRSLT